MSNIIARNKGIILGSLCLVVLLPLIFLGPHETLTIQGYLLKCLVPIILVTVFCLNYYWLVPKVYTKGRKCRYFTVNVILILMCSATLAIVHHIMQEKDREAKYSIIQAERHAWSKKRNAYDQDLLYYRKPQKKRQKEKGSYFWISTTLLSSLNLTLSVSLAFAIRSREMIIDLENKKRVAEMARQEAELVALKSNISPHFLLNTLNNIYALAAIDPVRTQKAVVQLSRLLRHTLYDNKQEFVPLVSEGHFILDYVSLMRLRMPHTVEVETKIQIDESSQTQIAPLIFISLVENAFKHGVYATRKSTIRIMLHEDSENIVCVTENTNSPKTSSDRSGHGIGLKLVQQRLDSLYRGRYNWEKGVNTEDIYYSYLKIKKEKL